MKKLEIEGKTSRSQILINESLSNLSKYIHDKRTVIITDGRVFELYGEQFPDIPVIKIGSGEIIKTLATVENIYRELMELGIDRHSFIIGIGGGIVCDITGFVASTFMRGVPFGFVSSTLLSQVDASIGGKNGVNFQGYKNMIGVFSQPRFVICDIAMLKTLPSKELSNGFSELIKHALIADNDLFTFMENNQTDILELNPSVMEELVFKSVSIKADIVRQDETETGIRKKLNFGHTIGHALEKIKKISHGEAVSIGMVVSAYFSQRKGSLSPESLTRIINTLDNFSLPTGIPEGKNQILDAIKKDKKKDGDYVDFVFLKSIGDTYIEKVNMVVLEVMIDDLSGTG